MPSPAPKSKQWVVHTLQPELCHELSQALGITPFLAQLLINRGLTDPEQARFFLFAGLEHLHDPYLMKDMPAAVERIESAIANDELICIYGDYDADGITGAVLLSRILTRLGARHTTYIPHRTQEGYGLNTPAIRKIHAQGAKLLVSVDCGISNCAEVELAQSLGLDVIITDHHQPPRILPSAIAIVNPKQPGCPYPYKDLAGVGVAAKLCQAMLEKHGEAARLLDYLDIICLGTVADIAPLTGENRILVKYGLEKLTITSNLGIKKLKQAAGISDAAQVQVWDIEYRLAPRINAAGRMGNTDAVLRLLLTDSEAEAEELAGLLDEANRRRKQVEDGILKQARELAAAQFDPARDRALVLHHPEWHSGVIGIVAAKMVDEYNLPCVLLCTSGSPAKGSARSIAGFYLHEALEKLKSHLVAFGGHHYAAGLSIEPQNIEAFRAELNALAWKTLGSRELPPPELQLDGKISLDRLDGAIMADIMRMHPYGVANPEPVLFASGLQVMRYPREVGNNHLKMRLRQERAIYDSIGFNMADLVEKLDRASRNCNAIEAAFKPQFNYWQGREEIQLKLQDIRFNSEEDI